MKKLIAGISLLAFTWPAWGQYQANDSIVINRPNNYHQRQGTGNPCRRK